MNKCLCCGHEWKFKKRSDCSTNNSRNCPKCFSFIWDIGNNAECYCCEKIILNLVLHHKNNNHFDNSSRNRIGLCKTCHDAVHKNILPPNRARKTGLRRYGKINKKTIERINELKGYL